MYDERGCVVFGFFVTSVVSSFFFLVLRSVAGTVNLRRLNDKVVMSSRALLAQDCVLCLGGNF